MKTITIILFFISAVLSAQSESLASYESASIIPNWFNKTSTNQGQALELINSVRSNSDLEPLSLNIELSSLAADRLDSTATRGFYESSKDNTGELYYNTSREFDNYFYNAVIGLIIPGETNFTYEQITCEKCKEVGFASKIIGGKVWTMLVFDFLY